MSELVPILIFFQLGVFVLLIVFYATRIRRVAANEALIVSGRGDAVTKRPYRVVIGPGRSFIWPVVERVDSLSLETLRHDFVISGAQTGDGKTITAKGTVQVKVTAEAEAIANAVRHLLSKSELEIKLIVGDLLEDQFRTHVKDLPRDAALSTTTTIAEELKTAVHPNLAEIGMECVTCIIKNIK